jgi:chemotaxis protein MotB
MNVDSHDPLLDTPPATGAPEWLMTYGDLMSLLLTFFILLVSMSELRNEPRVVEAVDAIQKRFGREKTTDLPTFDAPPGGPRAGRPQVKALGGDRQPVFGGTVTFAEGSAEVTDDQREALRHLGEQLQGKLQKIEIRGHTTRRPLPAGSPFADHWQLAYARSHEVMRLLTEQGIDAKRLRLSVAGGNEPAYVGDDARELRANGRVDLFLLNEFTGDDEKSNSPPSPAQTAR